MKILAIINVILLVFTAAMLYDISSSVSYNAGNAVLNRVGMLNNRVELSEVDHRIKKLEAASPSIEKLNSLERKMKAHINRN